MAKYSSRAHGLKQHDFRNKLLLNQWLISLFGIDSLSEKYQVARASRLFHDLVKALKDCPEGLGSDSLHIFYHALVDSSLFWDEIRFISKEQIPAYEENIVRHSESICDPSYKR